MDLLKKILFKFIIPLVIFIILFIYNNLIAIALLAVFIIHKLYLGRSDIMAGIGKFVYSRGNVDGSLVWFKRASGIGKFKIKNQIIYAYLLLKCGHLEESEVLFDRLLDSKLDESDRMMVKSNYALVLWKKDRLDDAIAVLEEVFKDYRTTVVYGSLGYLLILKGDVDRALEFNREAYEYNSSNNVIQDNLGLSYYLKGEYDKAKEVFEKLISANPTFSEAYYNYGRVLMKLNERDRALEFFKKAQGYRISFLGTVTGEEIQSEIDELTKQS